jgi:hypothetical protein
MLDLHIPAWRLCRRAYFSTIEAHRRCARTFAVLQPSMSKQSKPTAASAATVASQLDTSPCTVCRETFLAEIQAIIQTNHGVLTAENKAILEALPLLDTKGLVKILFNLMTEKQDASIEGVRFSPQKPAIVTIPKDGSFKKLVNPVDEHFFDEYKEDGVPTVEWWQHFSGTLLFNSNGKFGCAVCEVEAVPSANKQAINCPKRNQHGDMKVHTPTTFPYSHTPAASSKNRMLCHYEAQIGRMCGTEPRSRRSLQHFKGEAHCHIQVH